MNFEQLNLAPAILRGVHDMGYTEPTPIQEQAIPHVLQGHDLMAGAQTGTGKTAAFALPILQLLSERPAASPGAIRALILTPTRELAAQIEESLASYGKHLELRSVVIFGGVGANPQIKRIRAGCDILVATPGRLLDLEDQGHVDLSQVEILVLDEADRMLDMGFIHDVRKVLALVPKDKQSLLFSATFSSDIRRLARDLLKDPQSVQVTPPNTTVERIHQVIYPVGRDRKDDALLHLIREHGWEQVLIFTRTKFGANSVARFLSENGVTAMALHGNKSQSARTEALDRFKNGGLNALVATDIAARGIDIDELPHVVNYDIPNVPEDYVHRIGRTGRAGSDGEAASLVCLDEEGFMHAIERFTAQQIPVTVLPEFGPAEGEKAEPIAMGRQTLWGGLGPTPSREVMQEAGREARRKIRQRIQESRAARGGGSSGRGGRRNARNGSTATNDGEGSSTRNERRSERAADGDSADQQPRSRRSSHGRRSRSGRRRRTTEQNGSSEPTARSSQDDRRSNHAPREDDGMDRLPRDVDPLQINLGGRRSSRRSQASADGGIPDPLRTSADMMGRGGGRGKRSGSGGGRHKRSGR